MLKCYAKSINNRLSNIINNIKLVLAFIFTCYLGKKDHHKKGCLKAYPETLLWACVGAFFNLVNEKKRCGVEYEAAQEVTIQ